MWISKSEWETTRKRLGDLEERLSQVAQRSAPLQISTGELQWVYSSGIYRAMKYESLEIRDAILKLADAAGLEFHAKKKEEIPASVTLKKKPKAKA